MRRHTRLWRGLGMASIGLVAIASAAVATAQGFDPRRPKTVVVGAPKGEATMARVSPRRDGRASKALPTKKLHVEWKKTTGAPLENAPLVDETGRVIVAGVRGDVVFLGADGDERGRITTGASNPGPPALTGDGTVVFVAQNGEIVGARGTSRRFSVRLGLGGSAKVAPLPLADGGFVAAVGTELVLLDAEGSVRARAQAQEPIVGPLVGVGGRVVAASRAGTVFTWAPGAEVVRVGSFRATIDGSLAVEDHGHLLAITDQTQLTELDLARGTTTTRATAAPGSLYLGPPALGPNGTAILGNTFGVSYLVHIDRAGLETRTAVGVAPPASPTLLPDGGAPALTVPQHTGPLVDDQGTVAFITPEGVVGVASRGSGVSTLGDPPCGRGSAGRTALQPGLSPAGAGAFYVACESGTVVKVAGD